MRAGDVAVLVARRRNPPLGGPESAPQARRLPRRLDLPARRAAAPPGWIADSAGVTRRRGPRGSRSPCRSCWATCRSPFGDLRGRRGPRGLGRQPPGPPARRRGRESANPPPARAARPTSRSPTSAARRSASSTRGAGRRHLGAGPDDVGDQVRTLDFGSHGTVLVHLRHTRPKKRELAARGGDKVKIYGVPC